MNINPIIKELLLNGFELTLKQDDNDEMFDVEYSIDWLGEKLAFYDRVDYIRLSVGGESGLDLESFGKLAELYFNTWKLKNKLKPNSAALDLLWIPIGLNYNLIQEKTITIYEPNNV